MKQCAPANSRTTARARLEVASTALRSRRMLVLMCALATASLTSACGLPSFPQEGQPAPIQERLRDTASGGRGATAYWLGAKFHGAIITNVSGSGWTDYAEVSYAITNGTVASFDLTVLSYAHPAPKLTGPYVRAYVRFANGQDVVITFLTPRKPSKALLREARRAVQPIPIDAVYPP